MELFDAGAFIIEHWKAVTLVSGAFATLILGVKNRKAITTWIIRQFREEDVVRHNTCILLGQGGTGKTTLIKGVTNDDEAKPDLETISFKLHESRLMHRGLAYCIVFADYRGQDLAVLSEGLTKLTPSERQKIVSLVLMVDICDTNEGDGLPRDLNKPIDYDRVTAQIEQWCGQSLEAIIGIIGAGQLRVALIFVNKFDTLTIPERELHEPQLRSLCEPLQQKLKKVLPLVSVEVLLGAARGAESINIRNRLTHHAVA